MKIGELANLTQTQVETIRYYEREGLLPETARTGGNYRIYGDAHAARLSFIRHCRGLDMTLDEIRILLHFKDAPSENCGEVNALLDEHIGHVAAAYSGAADAGKAAQESAGAVPGGAGRRALRHPE
jgi:DNA-binding transcriptional MerR regulator